MYNIYKYNMFKPKIPYAFTLGGGGIEGGCRVTLIENGSILGEIVQNRTINELLIGNWPSAS